MALKQRLINTAKYILVPAGFTALGFFTGYLAFNKTAQPQPQIHQTHSDTKPVEKVIPDLYETLDDEIAAFIKDVKENADTIEDVDEIYAVDFDTAGPIHKTPLALGIGKSYKLTVKQGELEFLINYVDRKRQTKEVPVPFGGDGKIDTADRLEITAGKEEFLDYFIDGFKDKEKNEAYMKNLRHAWRLIKQRPGYINAQNGDQE